MFFFHAYVCTQNGRLLTTENMLTYWCDLAWGLISTTSVTIEHLPAYMLTQHGQFGTADQSMDEQESDHNTTKVISVSFQETTIDFVQETPI